MKYDVRKKRAFLLMLVFFIVSSNACVATGGRVYVGAGPELQQRCKGGPPLHAPAHGYQAKYCYRYYPSSYVYFDTDRNVYFYLENNNWRMTASLPHHIYLGPGGYVTIEMDSDKPYVRHREHKRKYPPGQFKKKKIKKSSY